MKKYTADIKITLRDFDTDEVADEAQFHSLHIGGRYESTYEAISAALHEARTLMRLAKSYTVRSEQPQRKLTLGPNISKENWVARGGPWTPEMIQAAAKHFELMLKPRPAQPVDPRPQLRFRSRMSGYYDATLYRPGKPDLRMTSQTARQLMDVAVREHAMLVDATQDEAEVKEDEV